MDVKIVNPFINATLHVLETISSTKTSPGKPFLKEDQKAHGDVTAVIGLTGGGERDNFGEFYRNLYPVHRLQNVWGGDDIYKQRDSRCRG